MIELVDSHALTEMNAMDSIVLSTFNSCCTIQLLCHMVSTPHILLQLPAYEPLPLLDHEYMSDQGYQSDEEYMSDQEYLSDQVSRC